MQSPAALYHHYPGNTKFVQNLGGHQLMGAWYAKQAVYTNDSKANTSLVSTNSTLGESNAPHSVQHSSAHNLPSISTKQASNDKKRSSSSSLTLVATRTVFCGLCGRRKPNTQYADYKHKKYGALPYSIQGFKVKICEDCFQLPLEDAREKILNIKVKHFDAYRADRIRHIDSLLSQVDESHKQGVAVCEDDFVDCNSCSTPTMFNPMSLSPVRDSKRQFTPSSSKQMKRAVYEEQMHHMTPEQADRTPLKKRIVHRRLSPHSDRPSKRRKICE